MRVGIGVSLIAAGLVMVLAWFAWLGFRVPAGVEFSRRHDGIEEMRIPTDRNFSVVHGRQHMIYIQGSVDGPDPTPHADSESIDPDHPIFPPRYVKDSGPPNWQTPATLAPCGLLGLPSEFSVKPVVVYKGELIATTRIPTRDHDYTSRVDVTVGNTGGPVVLILRSYEPVQWRVGQAFNAQLAGIVLVGFKPAELVGLPDTIPVFNATLPDAAECRLPTHNSEMPGLESGETVQLEVEALSRHLFNESALRVTYEYSASRIFVGGKNDYLESLRPFYSNDRGDVFRRDPDLLLPAELGLGQLRANGAVRRATAADIAPWEEAKRAGLQRNGFGSSNRTYVLLRQTELPDGLNAVDFLLPEGVRMPPGWSAGTRVCVEKRWRCGSERFLRSDR